jgi:hypothetical protein
MSPLELLPTPRRLTLLGGTFSLPYTGLIVLDTTDAQSLRLAAAILQATLREHAGVSWEIAAGTVPATHRRVVLSVVPGSVAHDQGYYLAITADCIYVTANHPVGVFYAVQTLCQLLAQRGGQLPVLQCLDWPDFAHRGVLLDISRDKVPTMETLYALIDTLASWKINQLQLYTEHTFAYRNHPQVWADASPLTGEEVLALDAYCRERFITLVPNQNTFGHLQRWLVHPAYRHLAECPDGCETRWGHMDEPFSLAPTEPGSLELVTSLLDELLPHFASQQVNVNCDETVDLGQGRSRARVAEVGMGRVYLEFLLRIYRAVKARNHTMQFWSDIIMEYPELVSELPRDVVALEWGYEAAHPFARRCARLAAAGIPFYVCPGTSSWRSLAGRVDNALANLRRAAEAGLQQGAVGYLVTDWGDLGHWQPLPVSYPGFAYGAAVAWAYQANVDLDMAHMLSTLVFHDAQGQMGRLAIELGNLYQAIGVEPENSSVFFNILQAAPDDIPGLLTTVGDPEHIEASLWSVRAQLDDFMAALAATSMQRPDAALVQWEYSWVARMLNHACRRAEWALARAAGRDTAAARKALAHEADGLIAEFRVIWYSRNRPGGFRDSLARMEKMREEYGG